MTRGIGLGGAVFLVLLVLKLIGVIAWSWLWITAPLWIPVLIMLATFGVIAAFAVSKALR